MLCYFATPPSPPPRLTTSISIFFSPHTCAIVLCRGFTARPAVPAAHSMPAHAPQGPTPRPPLPAQCAHPAHLLGPLGACQPAPLASSTPSSGPPPTPPAYPARLATLAIPLGSGATLARVPAAPPQGMAALRAPPPPPVPCCANRGSTAPGARPRPPYPACRPPIAPWRG
jgi:hypothetical protein